MLTSFSHPETRIMKSPLSLSQLALNPRTKEFANAVPSVATKKNKKHWKRNDDKEKNLNNCG